MRAHTRIPAVDALPDPAPDPETDDPAGAPAPANRAARRGRANARTSSGAVRTGSAGRARAAQGRRINPVRRTG
jgi:hypothetical protein